MNEPTLISNNIIDPEKWEEAIELLHLAARVLLTNNDDPECDSLNLEIEDFLESL